MSARRTWARAAIATALALFGIECALRLAGSGHAPRAVLEELRHCRHDPELGWSNIPGTRIEDLYGKGRSLTLNARGFRGTSETPVAIPPGRQRIVCLGDSFTMGYGVDDTDTLPAFLERLDPVIETVNMGLGGYGLDQAYLWYRRDGNAFDANMLLLSFIDADFIRVAQDVFQGYPKPILGLRDGELVITNAPVPIATRPEGEGWLGRLALAHAVRDLFARAPGTSGVPFDIVARLLDELTEMTRASRRHFVLVYIPKVNKIERGRVPTRIARWIRDYAEQRELPFIDLTPAFAALSADELDAAFLPDGHLDVAGNELAARAILEGLRDRFRKVVR